VVAEARQKPKTAGPIKEEMDRTGKVDTAYKKLQELAEGHKEPKPQFALEQLKRAWKKATAEEREEFLQWIQEVQK